MAKEREKTQSSKATGAQQHKVFHEEHVIHERKLRYYKKTVQLLTVGLEVFFLFLIGAIIFLFVRSEENIQLQAENSELQLEIQAMHAQVETMRDQVLETSFSLPTTQLKENKLVALFSLPNGIPTNITVQLDDVISQIREGYQRRELVEEVNIPMHTKYAQTCYDFTSFFSTEETAAQLKKYYSEELTLLKEAGPTYLNLPIHEVNEYVMDFRDYVTPIGFEEEIQTWYESRNSDEAFLYELWYVVSQLTTFSEEIEETPRFPLETLLLGGGDCEDTAILYASMLKAANTNWKIYFVYLDLANPQEAEKYNHVLIRVQTENEEFYIETTNKDVINPYQNVQGASVLIK